MIQNAMIGYRVLPSCDVISWYADD